MTLYAGDYWSLRYAPRIRLYSSDAYENSLDHTINLNGAALYGDWRFTLRHATAITSDPLIETGRQTDQTTHSSGLGARWDRGQRGAYTFSLSQNIRLADETGEGSSDTYSWVSQNWYDYPLRDRLRVGVGLAVGYDHVLQSTDMVNERLSFRGSGPIGDKLRYNIDAGVEFRQFTESDASTAVSPIVGANLVYQLLEKTAFSFGVSHDVNTSYFSQQFTENTSLQAGVVQSITDIWSARVTGGFRFSSYRSTTAGTDVQREDASSFANVSVSGAILPRLRVSLIYSFRGNDSDREGYTFNSHQVGMNLNWTL
jgi:hypothetical protein